MNKKKPISAFEQSLSRIRSDAQALAGEAEKASFPVLNDIFTQAVNILRGNMKANTNMPQDRAKKGSIGIATMRDGSILRSDGTKEQTPMSQRLNTLRENVLSQTNFTPQAQQYIRGIELDYQTPQGAFGVHELQKRGPNQPVKRRIGIGPDVFKYGPTTPTEVMTHELLHAMDANISGDAEASYLPEGDKSGDSYEFYPGMKSKEKNSILNNIDSFLSRYKSAGQQQDPYTSDVEGFAQYGATRGEKVLLGPLKNSYGDIFSPATKVQYSSPIYPTRNTWSNLFRELEKGDAFNG